MFVVGLLLLAAAAGVRGAGGRRRGRRRQHLDAARVSTNMSAPALPFNLSLLDPTCHARPHSGYQGDRAVVWGMSFKLRDPGECCQACRAHATVCGTPDSTDIVFWPDRPDLKCHKAPRCNIWTFCPETQCFAFNDHRHTFGECWLKQQSVEPTRPRDPFEGYQRFPAKLRASPRRIWPWSVSMNTWPGPMPERIPWVSGVLADAAAQVVSAPPHDRWRHRWCQRHGPCDEVETPTP
jgi:hypothetical protein